MVSCVSVIEIEFLLEIIYLSERADSKLHPFISHTHTSSTRSYPTVSNPSLALAKSWPTSEFKCELVYKIQMVFDAAVCFRKTG